MDKPEDRIVELEKMIAELEAQLYEPCLNELREHARVEELTARVAELEKLVAKNHAEREHLYQTTRSLAEIAMQAEQHRDVAQARIKELEAQVRRGK